jgi:NAD+ synthase (glutamine-hydrolysing)
MRLVRIGLASANTTVGAFAANTDKAIRLAGEMAADGVTVGVFQEQAIGGYPVEDLIQWQGFVDGQWPHLERFAAATADYPALFVIGVAVDWQGLRYNCAAAVAGGRIRALVPKEKLPTYNIFYEGRTFARGVIAGLGEVRGVPFGDLIVRCDFGTVALEVCEDLWSVEGPIKRRSYSGAELVCNVSSSPYRLGVVQTRRELIATRASDHGVTIAYANAVGANDGLIFDGGGFVNQNGKPMLEAPRWREGFAAVTVDLDRTARLRTENSTWRLDQEAWAATAAPVPTVAVPETELATAAGRARLTYPVPASRSFFLPDAAPRPDARSAFCEDLLDALTLGLGDYFEKNPFFKLIGVSLSGGRDSLLTLLVAHRYARRVRPDDPGSLLRAFTMPSRHTSAETLDAARTICRELGVPLAEVPIAEAAEREQAAAEGMLGGEPITEITRQNIQARIRGQRMWNWSNSSAGLFLQTGNMSEKAVGYTTIGGDLEGALGVLANVPKTVVMALLDYLLEQTGYEGIRKVLAKPAGPELAPDQVGEEELMPFPILDACFHLFAAEKLLPAEVEAALAAMFPEVAGERLRGYVEKFTRLFLGSIYKWVQAPISLHVGTLDLDRERALQLPVVQDRSWTLGGADAAAANGRSDEAVPAEASRARTV